LRHLHDQWLKLLEVEILNAARAQSVEEVALHHHVLLPWLLVDLGQLHDPILIHPGDVEMVPLLQENKGFPNSKLGERGTWWQLLA
jgi:hypothetical protein